MTNNKTIDLQWKPRIKHKRNINKVKQPQNKQMNVKRNQ